MTPAQQAAFSAATGGPESALLLAVASVAIVAGLLWLVWLAMTLFGAMSDRRIDFLTFAWFVVRGSVVLSLFVMFIR